MALLLDDFLPFCLHDYSRTEILKLNFKTFQNIFSLESSDAKTQTYLSLADILATKSSAHERLPGRILRTGTFVHLDFYI